jgi:hypothetical protein
VGGAFFSQISTAACFRIHAGTEFDDSALPKITDEFVFYAQKREVRAPVGRRHDTADP